MISDAAPDPPGGPRHDDARGLAEFYRELFGLRYHAGHERPATGDPDPRGTDWLNLVNDDGIPLAFQQVAEFASPTWPDPRIPQQLHLDATVESIAELEEQHERALALGARLLEDRISDPEEPLRVYADPQSHPFCIIVA